MAKKSVQVPSAPLKKKPGVRVMYVNVAVTPWYLNFWVLFFGGSALFLAGGIIGRFLSFGSIPRPAPVAV
jgi:hypothetical protein